MKAYLNYEELDVFRTDGFPTYIVRDRRDDGYIVVLRTSIDNDLVYARVVEDGELKLTYQTDRFTRRRVARDLRRELGLLRE